LGFKNDDGTVHNLLNNVTFDIEEGRAVGIVGESGCGKSMTNLSVMRLLPPSAVIQGGKIIYRGQNLLKNTDEEMENIRGKDITMIFQEPMTSLNPVLNIGFQIGEVLKKHRPDMNKEQIKNAVTNQLELVGIPSPEKRLKQYPYQFSGGMCQRVMIAMATICQLTSY